MTLIRDKIFDYAIIGGCPTGLTLAWLLIKAGKTVVVLEALTIGIETTGSYHNAIETIKLPLPVSNSPDSKIQTFSPEDVNLHSKGLFTKLISSCAIDCDLKKFRNKRKLQIGHLQQPLDGVDNPEGEITLNSLKYINGIARACSQAGGSIMGGRRILKVKKEDGRQVVYTSKGMVQCLDVVYTPRSSRLLMLYPKSFNPVKTYSILAQLDETIFRDNECGRLKNGIKYIITPDGANTFLELTGAEHRIIKGISNDKQFGILQKYIIDHFGSDHFLLRWSVPYYKAVDGNMYVGKISENVHMVGGYCFSNFTLSTFAAILLTAKLIGKEKTDNITAIKKVSTEVIVATGRVHGKISEEEIRIDLNKGKNT